MFPTCKDIFVLLKFPGRPLGVLTVLKTGSNVLAVSLGIHTYMVYGGNPTTKAKTPGGQGWKRFLKFGNIEIHEFKFFFRLSWTEMNIFQ